MTIAFFSETIFQVLNIEATKPVGEMSALIKILLSAMIIIIKN